MQYPNDCVWTLCRAGLRVHTEHVGLQAPATVGRADALLTALGSWVKKNVPELARNRRFQALPVGLATRD